MRSITETVASPQVNGNAKNHNAHADIEDSIGTNGTTPADLAQRYELKRETANGKVEYHGSNPFEAGAAQDGFILNDDGTAFDRKINRRYTSPEVARLAGLSRDEYAPCREYSQRNGSAFNGNGHSAPQLPTKPKAPFNWNTATIHEYRDELGDLLFQVGRVGLGDAKNLRQRRPNGRGGWIHNLENTRRVLYNLPDILQTQTVLIVEGEKAADAINDQLRQIGKYGAGGYVATTAPHGAGKFRAEYAEVLKGKTICVLPDNDESGATGADATLQVLDSQGIKAKRVELRDLPPKGDAADYLAAGNDVKQLLALCDGAAIWMPEEDAPDESSTRKVAPAFEFFDFDALGKMPRLQWLVRGLLLEKISSVISADTGGFKSFFAEDMGICIASGRPFMGRETKQGAVVYVAAEGFFTLHDRATAYALHYNCELPKNFHALKRPVNMGDEATVAAFGEAVEEFAPVLIILDTLSQCAIGADENSNPQMADFVRGMMALGERIGAHVTVLHHNGKASGTYRGAGSIKANVDAHISMERPEKDETNTVFVRCEKQRGKPFEAFALRGVEIELPFVDEYGDAVTSLVFEPCGDEVTAKSAKHPNAQKANKTRIALMEVFDELAAKSDGVKVGTWKSEAEKADPPICGERAFWDHLRELKDPKSGEIVESGKHNNSALWVRRQSAATTATTAKCSECSSPVQCGVTYCNNCNNPLGVAVTAVPTAPAETAAPALPEMPPKSKRQKPNASADSEAYQAPEKDVFDDEDVAP